MTKLSHAALLSLPLLLATAGCEPQPETVSTTAPDPQAEEMARRPKVELPPAVRAEVTFRCKDNSLVYVDFFKGDKQANLMTTKGGTPVRLAAPEAGQPYVADGYSLTGDEKNITLVQPGKGSLTCRA